MQRGQGADQREAISSCRSEPYLWVLVLIPQLCVWKRVSHKKEEVHPDT